MTKSTQSLAPAPPGVGRPAIEGPFSAAPSRLGVGQSATEGPFSAAPSRLGLGQSATEGPFSAAPSRLGLGRPATEGPFSAARARLGVGRPAIEGLLSAAPARLGATKLVLIDGHSGAGKTTFAEGLSRSVGGELVHTDDLLDGWDDQFTYWKRLARNVFEPIADGRPGGYWRYDWGQGKFTEWVPVKPCPILIVEGVGSARAEGRALASLSIFIDVSRRVREARSLARDGEAMQTQLARWRHREDLHFGADATAWCADVVIG